MADGVHAVHGGVLCFRIALWPLSCIVEWTLESMYLFCRAGNRSSLSARAGSAFRPEIQAESYKDQLRGQAAHADFPLAAYFEPTILALLTEPPLEN